MDISLNYAEAGQGQPLILLHGNGEDLHIFDAQLADFSAHFHVYAVDTRGHGQSPRGTAPFTIAQFADDLRAFMDAHSIEKAHIFGFSDGANIAMVFAIKYPDRVGRLILNSGNADFWGLKLSFSIPLLLRYTLTKLLHRGKKEEMLALMVRDPHLSFDDIHQIKAKTLVLAGDKDLIYARHTQKIAASINRSALRFVHGPHGVVHLRPQAVNPIVIDFLNR